METIRANDVLILAKKEGVYGTDAAATGAANAVLTNSFEATPLDATLVQRDLDRPGLGAAPDLVGATSARCTFKVEAASSGAAGIAPAFNDLLLASQLAGTATEDTDVAYQPVSKSFDSASLTFFYGGLRQKILGWRGAVGFELQAAGIPYLNFSGVGLHSLPDDTAQPEADFSKFQMPELVDFDSTQAVSFAGVSHPFLSFTISAADNVGYRDLPGERLAKITSDRRTTGQLEVLAGATSHFNPQKVMKDGTLSALSLEHGSRSGNKVLVTAPAVQITGVSFGENEGERTYQLELLFTASDNGDDEIKYIFR